jgi:pyruvyltransferase
MREATLTHSSRGGELYWWRPRPKFGVVPRRKNLGDELSPFIVAKVKNELGISGAWQPRGRKLLAIGSIINHAGDGDVLWGSGINGIKHERDYRFTSLDVRAVRGPHTAAFLRQRGVHVPELFGDPGFLISRYVRPSRPRGGRGALYIPHYRDAGRDEPGIRNLRTYGVDFQHFVDTIWESDIVYSASLHGLVIAEAYGVPAILVANAKTETALKYEDYYFGTGRSKFPTAGSLAEAKTLEPASAPEVDVVHERLLKGFPRELWSNP